MADEPAVELVIFIGLQASGKSTYYRQHLADTHVHVSKDNFPNARHRQARQLRLIEDALASGHDVAVDNTNPSPVEWTPLIEVGRRHGAHIVALWFPPDFAASARRNAARKKRQRVPDVGLRRVAGLLRQPEISDGFKEVRAVRMDGRGGFVVTPEA